MKDSIQEERQDKRFTAHINLQNEQWLLFKRVIKYEDNTNDSVTVTLIDNNNKSKTFLGVLNNCRWTSPTKNNEAMLWKFLKTNKAASSRIIKNLTQPVEHLYEANIQWYCFKRRFRFEIAKIRNVVKKVRSNNFKKRLNMFLLFIFIFTALESVNNHNSTKSFKSTETISNLSCKQMEYYIQQYADTFNIPLKYAYGIAFYETRYKGPKDSTYNHRKSSRAGAVGPMQIMLQTARSINNDKVSREELKNNIQYNVKTSMKLLRILYNKYADWKLVFGAYNTGHPIINRYAVKVYDYEPAWMGEYEVSLK